MVDVVRADKTKQAKLPGAKPVRDSGYQARDGDGLSQSARLSRRWYGAALAKIGIDSHELARMTHYVLYVEWCSPVFDHVRID